MATYTTYWADWLCDKVREAGLEGTALRLVWGGWNAATNLLRSKIDAGDEIVAVTVREGVVHLVGRMTVASKQGRDAWLRSHREDRPTVPHACATHVLAGEDGTPISLDRPVPRAVLARWRFASAKARRPLGPIEDGRLVQVTGLQGLHRLTDATAAALRRIA
jgi:hypothetical protein